MVVATTCLCEIGSCAVLPRVDRGGDLNGESHYALIVAGTGFATSFFLHRYLQSAPPTAKVLVLERGARDEHAWQVKNRKITSTNHLNTFSNPTGKHWLFSLGFGGGSNCWWACTPRLLPNDFRMKSLYGVGRDWPVTYDDLEPHYGVAEDLMAISGDSEDTPFPRSTPYPQPPHRFSSVDRELKRLHPDTFYHMPTGRARLATKDRGPCCANGVCHLCPIDAKFTIRSGMSAVYADPRVELRLGSEVVRLEMEGGTVKGVVLREKDGRDQVVKGDAVALGTNAMFNPAILLRSGITQPALGKGLHEQIGINTHVDLAEIDNFDGSTSITGHSYIDYDGEHRKERSGSLIETWNVPSLRLDKGKWRRRVMVKCIFEDLPQEGNQVKIDPEFPDKPVASFKGYSDYALKGVAQTRKIVERLVEGLEVEAIHVSPEPLNTEAHVLGTTVAGDDPADSVVDAGLLHHEHRNLWVLGGGAFPTCSPANPSLTIAAWSLYAAESAFS